MSSLPVAALPETHLPEKSLKKEEKA